MRTAVHRLRNAGDRVSDGARDAHRYLGEDSRRGGRHAGEIDLPGGAEPRDHEVHDLPCRDPAYQADPGLQSLEADYPGVIDAMIEAMQPEFEQGRVDPLPTLWAKTAAVYASNLSLDELQEAIAFYASPAGQQLSAAKHDAIANASSPSAETRSGSDPHSESKPDEVQLNRTFNSTATGQRLATLQPKIDAIVAAWSETPNPEVDARVTAALSNVVARYSRSASPSVQQRPTRPLEQPVVEPTEY